MHIPITQNAYSHNQIRISPPHFVCVYVYAGAINRPLQLLTACQLRGEHSANTQHPPTKCLTHTPSGVGADSSCPYPNIPKNAYPHYQLRVFISPRTHLCITIPIYSFFVVYNIEYKTTQYSIYIHVNCINYFLGYFLIKIQNRALHSTLYICMHPNFVLTSGRNCVPIILPIPSVEPRFISPLYRFHTQNGGKKHVHTEFSLPETVPNYEWTE